MKESRPMPTRARWRLSPRLQFTLWMMGSFILVQFALLRVVHLYETNSIEDIFDAGMHTRTDAVIRAIREEMPAITDAKLTALANLQPRPDELVIQVHDAQGQVLAASRRPAIELTPELLSDAPKAPDATPRKLPPDMVPSGRMRESPVRALATLFNGVDGRDYVVFIARSNVMPQNMRDLMDRVMIMGGIIGIVAMGISAYIGFGIAMRPSAQIKQ